MGGCLGAHSDRCAYYEHPDGGGGEQTPCSALPRTRLAQAGGERRGGGFALGTWLPPSTPPPPPPPPRRGGPPVSPPAGREQPRALPLPAGKEGDPANSLLRSVGGSLLPPLIPPPLQAALGGEIQGQPRKGSGAGGEPEGFGGQVTGREVVTHHPRRADAARGRREHERLLRRAHYSLTMELACHTALISACWSLVSSLWLCCAFRSLWCKDGLIWSD